MLAAALPMPPAPAIRTSRPASRVVSRCTHLRSCCRRTVVCRSAQTAETNVSAYSAMAPSKIPALLVTTMSLSTRAGKSSESTPTVDAATQRRRLLHPHSVASQSSRGCHTKATSASAASRARLSRSGTNRRSHPAGGCSSPGGGLAAEAPSTATTHEPSPRMPASRQEFLPGGAEAPARHDYDLASQHATARAKLTFQPPLISVTAGSPQYDMFKLPARTDTRQLMSIESLFSTEILRTAQDTTLAGVAEAMAAHDVGSMLVFDAGALVGVITERDIVRAAARPTDMSRARVSEHMTPDPWTVPVQWTARQVAIRMINHGIQHAPVTRNGEVVGVVSSFDLLAHLALSGEDTGHNEASRPATPTRWRAQDDEHD